MKRAFKIILIIILSLVVFKGVTAWINVQELKKKYPEISLELEGEMKTKDGDLTLYPYKVDSDYTGIKVFLRYKLSDEIKEKGFNMQPLLPDFTLKANPKESDRFLERGPRSESVLSDGVYIIARFDREKVKYEPQDLLRLYLRHCSLEKEINKTIRVEMDKIPQVIELDGIGELIIEEIGYDEENQNTLVLKTKTVSNLKNYITVYYSIYAEKDGAKIKPSGGSGSGDSGSDKPLVYTMEEKFYIDDYFREADNIYLEIHEVSTSIDNFNEDKPYIDFRIYNNN